MPYIVKTLRIAFDSEIESLVGKVDEPGDVAYIIYRLAKGVVTRWGGRFSDYATFMGAAGEALAEFRRRAIGLYEEKKKLENGDVE